MQLTALLAAGVGIVVLAGLRSSSLATCEGEGAAMTRECRSAVAAITGEVQDE